MFEDIGTEPIENPTRADKKRARLTKSERKFFYDHVSGHRCEVTGEPRTRKAKTEIHHIRPIAGELGGRKSLDNLVAVNEALHTKIHETARFICEHNPSKKWGEVVKELTERVLVDGKMDRVMKGEDPDIVYSRESWIEMAQTQMSFDDLEG